MTRFFTAALPLAAALALAPSQSLAQSGSVPSGKMLVQQYGQWTLSAGPKSCGLVRDDKDGSRVAITAMRTSTLATLGYTGSAFTFPSDYDGNALALSYNGATVPLLMVGLEMSSKNQPIVLGVFERDALPFSDTAKDAVYTHKGKTLVRITIDPGKEALAALRDCAVNGPAEG